jgi:hypothetical protein
MAPLSNVSSGWNQDVIQSCSPHHIHRSILHSRREYRAWVIGIIFKFYLSNVVLYVCQPSIGLAKLRTNKADHSLQTIWGDLVKSFTTKARLCLNTRPNSSFQTCLPSKILYLGALVFHHLEILIQWRRYS